MNIVNLFKLMLFLLLLSSSSFASDQIKGSWILEVENQNHKILSTLVIQFTKIKAFSCRGGDWFKIRVDSYNTSDKDFFPFSEPLSYEIKENKLIIGRNGVCDAYLQLVGEFNQSKIIGEYSTWGRSSEVLGYFSLTKSLKNK
jgi:hypothetical protein